MQANGAPRVQASKRRLAAAFTVAVISDVLSALLSLVPPVQWVIDIVTAVLLFMILGWRWAILPGLIAEAIPGFAVFPAWILVVGAIAVWGNIGPSKRAALPRQDVEDDRPHGN
jgi:hypothetical protein